MARTKIAWESLSAGDKMLVDCAVLCKAFHKYGAEQTVSDHRLAALRDYYTNDLHSAHPKNIEFTTNEGKQSLIGMALYLLEDAKDGDIQLPKELLEQLTHLPDPRTTNWIDRVVRNRDTNKLILR